MNPKVVRQLDLEKNWNEQEKCCQKPQQSFLSTTHHESEFFSPSLQNHLLLSTVSTVDTDGYATATEFMFQVHLLKERIYGFLWILVPNFWKRRCVQASGHPHPKNTQKGIGSTKNYMVAHRGREVNPRTWVVERQQITHYLLQNISRAHRI